MTVRIDEREFGDNSDTVVMAHPQRYAFAKFLRRALKIRKIRIKDAREELGVSTTEFNNWIDDERGHGSPVVPDDQDCHMIADFLGVTPDVVLNIAQDARDVMDEMVEVTKSELEGDVDHDNRGNMIG